MNKKLTNTLWFFLFSFVWTWLLYFLIIGFNLSPYEIPGSILLIIGGCSPSLIGFIMAMVTYNKIERKEYLISLYQVKNIKWRWLLLIIFLYPITMAMAIGFNYIIGGTGPEMAQIYGIIANPISIIFILILSFFSGPFAEELGWRGFAQKPLLNKFGFTYSALIIGVVWAIWHLPLYFMKETWHSSMGFGFTGLPLFTICCIADSVIMAFVYIKTKGSILTAILMHWISNLTGQLMATYSNQTEIIRVSILTIIVIVICIYSEKKKIIENEFSKLNVQIIEADN